MDGGTTGLTLDNELDTWLTQAHIVAGGASMLVKVRTTGTETLQAVLRDIYAIDGVTGAQTIVVLDTFFERPVPLREHHPALYEVLRTYYRQDPAERGGAVQAGWREPE